MPEAFVQAVLRLVRIFVVAGLGAVSVNLTILNGTLGSNPVAVIALALVPSVIEFVLKYLGGPTEPVTAHRLGAGIGSEVHRPSVWSV